ncbi:MAG: hypothetical protein M1834_000293 [Cirrosporium novae-zelandiae]|nr:MAG: hypothetical protein M1834_000293 [Cirrosporium novae-zelandiae]
MSNLASGAHIYTGPWINWDKGILAGSTITLSSRDAGLLTAFLGIFVTVAGGQLWRILSFIIHQSRASQGPQDGLHHQHQNIFRNTSSPGGASWQFTQLSIYWWSHAQRPVIRSLPWALLGILYVGAFGLAGVFSSEVTKAAGNERLVRSPNCGYWGVNPSQSYESQLAFGAKILNDSITAAAYARSCYDQANSLQCNIYAQKQILWTSNQNASCPFAKDTCIYGDTAAYEMDTGPIDSDKVLGINAPRHERITYRKKTTCAPLRTGKYATKINATEDDGAYPGDTLYRWWMGPIADVQNYSYEYNLHTAVDSVAYGIGALFALASYSGNSWIPIEQFNRTDGDVSIFWIAPNSVRFSQPVYDPVFQATSLGGSYISSQGQNISWYTADYWVSVLGCVDQHQYCNPNNGNCGPLAGYNPAWQAAVKTIGISTVQQGITDRVALQSAYLNTYHTVNGRDGAALRATETLNGLDQGPLPINQWQIEVSSWFNAAMARLQQGIVEYAAGPTNIEEGLITLHPSDDVSKGMCYSQKVRSANGTTSFSALGVAIILIVGTLIVFTNLVLDTVVGFLQRYLHKGEHRRLNWILDEKFQLQRMAFEEVSMGDWEGATAVVPVTKKGDKFGGYEGLDSKHPRLGGRKFLDQESGLLMGNKNPQAIEISEM